QVSTLSAIFLSHSCVIFFVTTTSTPASYTLSLHDALPIYGAVAPLAPFLISAARSGAAAPPRADRSPPAGRRSPAGPAPRRRFCPPRSDPGGGPQADRSAAGPPPRRTPGRPRRPGGSAPRREAARGTAGSPVPAPVRRRPRPPAARSPRSPPW